MPSENKTTQFNKDKYIQLTETYYEQDFAGRSTTIAKGSYGILIEIEEEIGTIYDVTPRQQEKCLALLRKAKESSRHFALITGYPCVVGKGQFIRKKPISSIVPWELI